MTGVEEKESGEKEKMVRDHGCVPFIVRGGEYISVVVKDYQKDTSQISKVFDELLKRPNIDPNGYCLEEYFEDEKDLRCSVPIK